MYPIAQGVAPAKVLIFGIPLTPEIAELFASDKPLVEIEIRTFSFPGTRPESAYFEQLPVEKLMIDPDHCVLVAELAFGTTADLGFPKLALSGVRLVADEAEFSMGGHDYIETNYVKTLVTNKSTLISGLMLRQRMGDFRYLGSPEMNTLRNAVNQSVIAAVNERARQIALSSCEANRWGINADVGAHQTRVRSTDNEVIAKSISEHADAILDLVDRYRFKDAKECFEIERQKLLTSGAKNEAAQLLANAVSMHADMSFKVPRDLIHSSVQQGLNAQFGLCVIAEAALSAHSPRTLAQSKFEEWIWEEAQIAIETAQDRSTQAWASDGFGFTRVINMLSKSYVVFLDAV